MANRQIPEGAVEIQTGLWLYSTDQINARFISVPVDPSYEIVSRPNNHETI